MRIAVFFPASLFAAHCVSFGLVNTLKRMGHEVVSLPIDPQKPYAPQVPEDGEVDAAIISGPEHLKALSSIKWKCPVVAWMHETVEREDYGKLDVEQIKRSADVIFCPGRQDEKYGFQFLPFGVDTTVFHADPLQPRTREAGFIGLVYPKRQEFLAKLRPLLNGTKFSVGNVQVLEVDGVNPQKTAELYALNLRSFKAFVNLPTLSQLAVTKIYEALACGTPVLTPKIEHMENLAGLQLVTYDSAEEAASLLRDLLAGKPLISIGACDPVGIAPRTSHCLAGLTNIDHSLERRCLVLLNALQQLGAKAA